jgi:sulfatase modifying factor 1
VSENMIELPGGTFRMGSDRFYPEERPVREVSVAPFAIDRHPVTIAEFRRFVRATALREAAASGRVAAETGV